MPNYRRDAGAALLCGGALLAALSWAGALGTLRVWPVAAVGVAGALGLEAMFLLDTPIESLWERPGVRAGGTVALLGGAAGLATVLGPAVIAAACWGLATYFVLLAGSLCRR